MAKGSRYDLRTYFTPTLSNGNYTPQERFNSAAYAKARAAGLSSAQISGLAQQQSLYLTPSAQHHSGYDAARAGAAANKPAARPPTPPASSADRYRDLINASRSSSQQPNYSDQISALQAGFAEQLAGVNASNEQMLGSLQGQIEQQSAAFAQAQQQFGSALAAQQAQFQEQSNQFANFQNARVPAAEKTAAAEFDSLGVDRSRTKKSPLSSLAIVSGLGTQANPLSGLQLA